MTAAQPSPLLDVKQAGAYLGKSRAWVYANAGEIGGSRIGGEIKFPLDELITYVERQRIVPPSPVAEPTPLRRPAVRGRGPINPVSQRPWRDAR